jgi:hypothetical protein
MSYHTILRSKFKKVLRSKNAEFSNSLMPSRHEIKNFKTQREKYDKNMTFK